MSLRSNMSSSRLPSSLPEHLRRVLDMRTNTNTCPNDIVERLLSMPFFQKTKEVRPAKAINRFANLVSNTGAPGFANGGAGAPPSQWRPAYSSSADPRGERRGDHRGDYRGDHRADYRNDYRRNENRNDIRYENRNENRHENRNDDGFQVWSGRKQVPRHTPASVPASSSSSSATPDAAASTSVAVSGSGSVSVSSAPTHVTEETEPEGPKFSSAAIKSSGETEDRILAKVKGKINKLGPMNYDATKTFMQQILDSDETEFLDEFMKFIFQKAATESAFCPLYAKLLHELADQFTHLRVVMTNLFRDYTAIFVEVETAPDVGTENYKAFVEALERKKFRRGYSQFVAELVKLGEANLDAFSELVQQIVTVLEAAYKAPENTLMCEEYIDCLANMCTSAPKILSRASWSDGVKDRLAKITKLPRSDTPGLTNKGRFALMDLVDFANRGWK